MTKKNATTVLGVYEDLDYRDSHMVADDTFQSVRYKELLEDGYQVMGTITRDTTPEEFDKIVHDTADKITPPQDDPIWKALAVYAYQGMSARNRCHLMLGTPERIAGFERDLEAHIANGGDEDEFCLSVLDQWRGTSGWDIEEGARTHEL